MIFRSKLEIASLHTYAALSHNAYFFLLISKYLSLHWTFSRQIFKLCRREAFLRFWGLLDNDNISAKSDEDNLLDSIKNRPV